MAYLLNVCCFSITIGAVLHFLSLLIVVGQEQARIVSFKSLFREDKKNSRVFEHFKRKVTIGHKSASEVPEVEHVTFPHESRELKREKTKEKISKYKILESSKKEKDLKTLIGPTYQHVMKEPNLPQRSEETIQLSKSFLRKVKTTSITACCFFVIVSLCYLLKCFKHRLWNIPPEPRNERLELQDLPAQDEAQELPYGEFQIYRQNLPEMQF